LHSIASGLDYLHSQNIIHADLKGLNILVSQSQRAYIADFGLATAIHTASTIMTQTTKNRVVGTLRWQAPELWPDMTSMMSGVETPDAELQNTKATDVYAFASVCYEIFSGNWPFHDLKKEYQIMFAVQSGKRPPRPSHDLSRIRGLNDEIWHLIDACWDQEPFQRPTSSQILNQLQALPNRPADQRPADDFEMSIPSELLHPGLKRPFSTLTTTSSEP
jgi:serine/threonine protein kinase